MAESKSAALPLGDAPIFDSGECRRRTILSEGPSGKRGPEKLSPLLEVDAGPRLVKLSAGDATLAFAGSPSQEGIFP